MKKTFKVQFPIAQAYIQTPMSYGTVQEPMMDFAGQEVTITVESAESEKPKCVVGGCGVNAIWRVESPGYAPFVCCHQHMQARIRCGDKHILEPIPPQPPQPLQPPEPVKPVVVELEHFVGKRFKVCFTEILH